MKCRFAELTLILALGSSSMAAAAPAASTACACTTSATSAASAIEAAPARSPATLVGDVAWLRALATSVSDAAGRLTDLNAAADAKDAARASARRVAASSAASAASSAKVAVPRGRAGVAASAVAIESPVDPPVVRSKAQVAWKHARFEDLRRLSIEESASGLPAVIVEPAFGGVRVVVTSGWLNAAQALVEAQALVGDATHACYVDYLRTLEEVFSADSKAERLVNPKSPLRRAVPGFAVFAERTPDCRPLLRRTWPQGRPDTRSAIEAGLVWWIGSSLTCQTSSWELPPPSASMAPESSSDRPAELLTAMGLHAADAQPLIALYSAAFHGGCLPR